MAEQIRVLFFSRPGAPMATPSSFFLPLESPAVLGDDFGTYGFPFIDVDSGGSINGMIDAVEKVILHLRRM